MIMSAIKQANNDFIQLGLPQRFTEDISQGDVVYDIYMAKKDNGKPKDDYPSRPFLT
jgi:hypothetical protein